MKGYIEDRVRYLAKVLIFPGEDEMLAMAEGAFRVLTGKEPLLEYEP
jgi:butyrate kinase